MKKESHKNHIEYRYLPECVYGSIDGIITTFAIIAGVIGAALSPTIILILGFANLFADGFSMAASNYLSRKSENQQRSKEQKRPFNTALATFIAFGVMGFIPLIPFVLASVTMNSHLMTYQFLYSFIVTGIALLIVGTFRGTINGTNIVKTALETFLIGGTAAAIAFIVGLLIKTIL